MVDLETSLNEEDFVEEVRAALAGLDDSKIPRDTILQAKNRFVEPLLNDSSVVFAKKEHQEAFDNASIAWTAEFAFDAWMTFTRLRDAEVEAYTDPKAYKRQLKSRTNKMLGVLGITRPTDYPNQVVTVKHDGEKRAVNLNKEWKVEPYGGEGEG